MPMLSYLDGASIGMFATAIAGGVAGVAVLMRVYWHRALGVFSKKHRAQAEEARAQLVTDGASSD